MLQILREATRRAPILNLAWAALGLLIVVAIVASLKMDFQVLTVGALLLLGLMIALYIVSVGVSRPDNAFIPATLLIYGVTILVLFSSSMLASSYFFHWPLEMNTGKSKIEAMVFSMEQAYKANEWDDAFRQANVILASEPEHERALNIAGSVAFFRQDFYRAAEYFERRLKVTPDSRANTSNLADTYVALGRFQDAINLYERIQPRDQTVTYELARAHVYAGEFQDAVDLLRSLPANESLGRSRVLLAAALRGLSQKESDPERKAQLEREVNDAFQEGVRRDPDYWRTMLYAERIDIYEDHSKIRTLLPDLISQTFG